LAQGIALYDPQQHRASAFLYGEDAGVFCWSQDARTLWHLGYPDQGRVRNDEAVTLAQQIAHPLSRSFALSAAAMFHQFRREMRAAQERVEAAIILAKEQGFPFWMAFGAMLRGWVLTQQGQAKEGIEQLNQGLMAFRATGVENIRPDTVGQPISTRYGCCCCFGFFRFLGLQRRHMRGTIFGTWGFANSNRPYFLGLLAEAYWTMGQSETGLTVLAEALMVHRRL
jgi:hypothetical protein